MVKKCGVGYWIFILQRKWLHLRFWKTLCHSYLSRHLFQFSQFLSHSPIINDTIFRYKKLISVETKLQTSTWINFLKLWFPHWYILELVKFLGKKCQHLSPMSGTIKLTISGHVTWTSVLWLWCLTKVENLWFGLTHYFTNKNLEFHRN